MADVAEDKLATAKDKTHNQLFRTDEKLLKAEDKLFAIPDKPEDKVVAYCKGVNEKALRSSLFVERWNEGLPGTWSPVACMSPSTGASPRSSLGSELDVSVLTDVSTDSLLETSSFETDADLGDPAKRNGSYDLAVCEVNTILDLLEEKKDNAIPDLVAPGWMVESREKRRSFSLMTPPDLSLLEIPEKIPEIPEVVVTDHDVDTVVVTDHDGQEKDVEEVVYPRLGRLLHRSNSSPGVLLPLPSKARRASCQHISRAEEPPINNNINNAVTLDDIARMGKKKKTSNAGHSCDRGSLILNDDSWSYTNYSSSKSGDTESLFNSDIEGVQEEPREPRSKLSGLKKASRWKKLRNMVRWTPFIMTYKKRKYPWIQLSGHPGNFVRGEKQGTVLKKAGEQEEKCYRQLQEDELCDVVPKYYQTLTYTDGKKYLELQCCLSDFVEPNVMDIKMGVRTFRETEAKGCSLRPDMYKKMINTDKNEPTKEEHQAEAITKCRYLTWRDTASSSQSLGFRIEGTTIRGKSSKDYKQMKSTDDLIDLFQRFVSNEIVTKEYIDRLKAIKQSCLRSTFFSQHELIGTSLLLVHDLGAAGVWMIDFEKTAALPPATTIEHNKPWVLGNHEDGFLIGLDSLIEILSRVAQGNTAVKQL